MRRPAPLYFAAFAGGIITEYTLEGELMLSAVLCAVVMAAPFLLSDKHNKGRGVNFVLALLFVSGCVLMCGAMNSEGEAATEDADLTGLVVSVKSKADDSHKIVFKTHKGRVLASYYGKLKNPETLVGRMVRIKGSIEEPKPRSNPDCFDYRLYLRSRGITKVMNASSVEPGPVESGLSHRLALMRSSFMERINGTMEEDQAAITIAMLFGDKTGLDEELYESFQRNGTAHILAVSGLHMGMIYALLAGLFGGRRKIRVNLVIAVILIAYAALADFSPSVVRAVIMIILHITAKLCHERYDILSAACVTGFIMLVKNPYALFGAGFQLSFFAVTIISFLMPLTENLKLPDPVKSALLPGITIQFGMSLLTAYMFNYFSLAGFIANIPVVLLAGLIVPIGVILMAIQLLIPGFIEAGGGVLGNIVDLMVKINSWMYAEGGTSFDVPSPPLWAVLCGYTAIFFISSEYGRIMWHRKEKRRWAFQLGALLAVSVALGAYYGNPFNSAQCIFVDVGQGSCVHLRSPSGEDLLVDGGGKTSFGATKEEREKYDYDVGEKILRPYLLKNGVTKVDIAMVTHLDADHYKGIASICRRGMVKKLALHECLKSEEEKVLTETKMNKNDLIYLKTGQVFKSKGFSMKVVGPPPVSLSSGGNSDNENSMVIKAQWEEFSALITGDIDENAERNLIAAGADITADVVAVPHHGSKYSSTEEFIKSTQAKVAVIQVGKNNYGHPAPEVIRRYKAAGVRVYRNDQQGAVGICEKKIKTKTLNYSPKSDEMILTVQN